MARGKISKRTVDAFKAGDRDDFLWDTDLKGFGVKCTPTGRRVYIIAYRPNGAGRNATKKRYTIGEHGKLTPQQARGEAERLLSRVKLGTDPAGERATHKREQTIGQLCDRYLDEHVKPHNKPSTRMEIARIIETRVRPEFATVKISDLTRARIKAWHSAMHLTPYEANRALAYLSKMLSLAATEWELRPDNPCKGIKRFPEKRRERFYSMDELRRIGKAVSTMERDNSILPGCALAIRILALTGARVGEVLSWRWEHLDASAGVIRMPDGKTGSRTQTIGAPLLALLSGLERMGNWIVTGTDPKAPLSQNTLNHTWHRVREHAKIPDGRLHDFRHTIGTYGASTGANAFLVRDLLGHKTIAMTSRYVERYADPVRELADKTSMRVAAALAGTDKHGEVVDLVPQRAR